MNDILLPIFLFMVYFNFGLVILNEMRLISEKQSQPLPDYNKAFAEENDPLEEKTPPTPLTKNDNVSLQKNEDEMTEEEAQSSSQSRMTQVSSIKNSQPNNPDIGEDLTLIIQQLKQPQLRKLCHPLGIKQKTNGVWISTDSMRKAIQNQIKQQPQTVIQAMNQRLPQIDLNLPDIA